MRSRITVVENVYCETDQGPGSPVRSAYMQEVVSEEQPYVRHQQVTEEWHPLDVGWLLTAGLMHLSIDAPKWNRTPTPDEAKAAMDIYVEVALYDNIPTPFATVRPGRSLRLECTELAWYRVRSVNGPQTLVVRLYPG